VQRELLANTVVELAYVGNRGVHLETETVSAQGNVNTYRNFNALPNQFLSGDPIRTDANRQSNSYITANLPNPFYRLSNMGPLASTSTIARSRLVRPYPQFQEIRTTDNAGSSSYHALQARVERRYAAGLTVNLAYSWSKFLERLTYLNDGDLVPSKSVALQDHPHRITVSGIYELPIGRGKPVLGQTKALPNAILGGWQFQAIYSYQTGPPLTWLDTTMFTAGDAVSLGTRDPQRWFDTSQFLRDTNLRPQNHLRTWPLRFSNLRGDATHNWDRSVIKKWSIRERFGFQLRGEFLNALNHPLFNTTAGIGNPIIMDPYVSTFGKISQTAAYPREVQVGLKMTF
jgi:hypothetical protein